MFAEALIAFALILASALFIYGLGRRASPPKHVQSESERSEYACGERAPIQRLKINVSLYRYLIYFAIFDSSVLLLAFSTLSGQGVNVTLLILYLFVMLASCLILFEGGKDQ